MIQILVSQKPAGPERTGTLGKVLMCNMHYWNSNESRMGQLEELSVSWEILISLSLYRSSVAMCRPFGRITINVIRN